MQSILRVAVLTMVFLRNRMRRRVAGGGLFCLWALLALGGGGCEPMSGSPAAARGAWALAPVANAASASVESGAAVPEALVAQVSADAECVPSSACGTGVQASPEDAPGVMTARSLTGDALAVCGTDPMTGYYREGFCETGPDDTGRHVVCAEVTEAFLQFTAGRGNDLMTPRPPGFPGLTPGDRWCLCALRWREAWEAGVAPPVVLSATNEAALQYVDRDALEAHALSVPGTTL